MIKRFSLLRKKLKNNFNIIKDNNNSGKRPNFIDEREETKKLNLANEYGLDYTTYHCLPKAYINNENAFFTYSGLVYFYPPNDGEPTKPVNFYVDHNLVLRNTNAFQEIENLDELLLKMVEIIDKAYDKKISINPYGFMLHLEDKLEKDYKGKATLVMTNNSFSKNDLKHRKYFINRFLDHFIGWNFGVSVNRNEKLKEALINLNNKVINSGLREDAGPGFEVYGTENDVYKGLQHYYLPTSNDNYQKRK